LQLLRLITAAEEKDYPMRSIFSWTVLSFLVSSISAQADPSAVPGGRALAMDYCSACHRVSAEQAPRPKLTIDTGSGMQDFEVPASGK
jgi:mono/diheme cytochrome c family protein